ncbi:hypothetical protein PIB30_043865 [Stylosanthes scabra]|uniref:Ubiquitin-like protease family profile domain-containing protein n=1 Tax=Stylosanthes scabra TaxID=79078 RepID=A0ABU6QF28_9FABA|nr:hypothetical protein [Stylosanthes scabra]
MPKKLRESASKKAREKDRGCSTEKWSKKKGIVAETSRYGSLCGITDFVDVLYRKWHGRNIVTHHRGGGRTWHGAAGSGVARRPEAAYSPTGIHHHGSDDGSAVYEEASADGSAKSVKVCVPFLCLKQFASSLRINGKRILRMIMSIVAFAFQRKLELARFTAEDMNILYSIKQMYIGSPFAYLSHNRYQMMGEECPTFLELAFRPPPGMPFVGMELAITVYIFASAGEETEVLYQDNHCDGSRRRFLSLVPGNELYDDVLNMVVGMCTGTKDDNRRWWLSTTFSQMILEPRQFNQPTMDYIAHRYMGKADDITRIYVPLHVENHWYLMIIDMWDKKLVYLDSLKASDIKVIELRISRMKEVANKEMGHKLFSPFPLDCGVWVCQWMVNSHLWRDYELEEVNESTRMSLVIDLVTSPHNPLGEIISDRSVNFWDAEMLRNYKAQKGRQGKAKSLAGSGSVTI